MRPLIVHLVHGTWAYGLGGRERWERRHEADPKRFPLPWFRPGSDFCREVGEAADRPLEFRPFEWSGENSFVARHEAAARLREELTAEMENDGATEHAIVAHSHGGTVAFDALACGAALPRNPVALVTLGTPFAALRQLKASRAEMLMRFVSGARFFFILVACLLAASSLHAWTLDESWSRWIWLPAGALLLAYPWVVRRSGAAARALADLLPSLVAAWIAASATVWAWQRDEFGGLIAYLTLAVVVALVLLGRFAPHWALRPHEGLTRLLAPDRYHRMPGRFHALRTPGDEASLGIALAQTIDRCLSQLTAGGLVGGLGRLLELGEKRLGFFFVVALWIAVALGRLGWDLLAGDGFDPWWVYIIEAIMGVGIGFVLVGALIVAVVAPLSVHVGTLALRFATGGAVLRYAGLVAVEVEPVPAGASATVETLRVETDERTSGLSHSLHERRETRLRVAELLGGDLPEGEGASA